MFGFIPEVFLGGVVIVLLMAIVFGIWNLIERSK